MTNYSAQGIVLVKRKPATADEAVLKQQITLVAKDGAKMYKISDLTQFIKDLEGAGIVVANNSITLVAKQTKVQGINGNPIAVFNDDGSINANLINADTITVNHLYAKSGQNGSVVGHFGNYDKSDAVVKVDSSTTTQCPLWLGATTAANAPFRVTKDGAMYAVKGKIGGFEINESSIGSADLNRSINGLFLSSEHILFNKTNRHVVLGTWEASGSPVLAWFVDEKIDSRRSFGLAITVKNKPYDSNVAFDIGGGYMQGLSLKTQHIGFDEITSTTRPTSKSVQLDRLVHALHVSTQFKWRANYSKDFSYETRDVYITLPEMHDYDNGHIIKIKRGANNGSAVYIRPGVSYVSNYDNGTKVDVSHKTFIIYDKAEQTTGDLKMESAGDAFELIYFHNIKTTINGTEYIGAWVQWKNPRDW